MRPTRILRSSMLSYASGPGSGLLGVTVGDALRQTAGKWGNHDALVVSSEKNVRWTYSELLDRAESVASGLVALGLPKHARIGIYGPNTSEWVVAQMAASLADLILVNINPGYQAVELKHALHKVQVSALIMATGFKSSDYVELVTSIVPELENATSSTIHSPSLPYLKHCLLMGTERRKGFMNFNELYKLADTKSEEYQTRTSNVNFEDPTNIQFTSGTTGDPKAATLTHHNIINNGYFTGKLLGYTPADRVCIPVPLYHCFGMVLGNLACITHGACIVLPDASFNPVATMDAVHNEKVTSLYGVPTMFIACLKEQEAKKRNVSSLRTGIVAGAICPPVVMQSIVDTLGIKEMTNAYGMTETAPLSFQLPRDATMERRITSVGLIHPHVEAKVVDLDTGLVVRRGDPGELQTRGYNVMSGYWADEEATQKAITPAGWMKTGDIAVMSEDGYLSIVGRCKDVIIRGGENISPSEVEHFLATHPRVEEVHVFGIPDEVLGEKVAVWMRMRDPADILTKQELHDFCHHKIAHFKIPSELKIVDQFPMTVTGKVMKFKMRDEYSKKN